MEITYITLQDTCREGRIRFVSQSVEDLLGHKPDDMVNVSAWEFVHPDDTPRLLELYESDLSHDRAASVHCLRLRHKEGHYVECETVATIVYNVLITRTTVYTDGPDSGRKMADAAIVQKLFASSRDPEYRMLSSISGGFSPAPSLASPEPRAAMILNRYTRLSTIIYATSNTPAILGLTPTQLLSQSFYYCVAECCMRRAIQCIERSKTNDSVAYLRFWFRNPLDEGLEGGDSDDEIAHSPVSTRSSTQDSLLSSPMSREFPRSGTSPIEVEAAVSCSSDGIIVVLRRAAGPFPGHLEHPGQSHPVYVESSRPSSAGSWAMSQSGGKQVAEFSGPDTGALITSIREAALFGIEGRNRAAEAS